RKRSQRRKENKVKHEQEERQVDEKSIALEEQKVLLFNCSEVVDFNSGDTILPTRITCYCRHHNERLGFCIYFEMLDHTGKQVATGMSPPIMITDDHKSNKVKADSPMGGNSPFIEKAMSPVPAPNTERPSLQRLIPNEGPTFGGVEVTLLGSGFRAGLTCMFGDVAASSTHFWSPNTLVCILPPAAEAGTVVVSFKEYPLVVDSQDVTLFTYYNENDRALMELALQVVGLKMTGKVEDARDIAMRIVQGGGNNNNGNGSNTTSSSAPADTTTQKMCLERHIIQVLQVMCAFRDVESSDVSLTSAQGHSMLHLAAMLGFAQLTDMLIDLGCDVNITDKNGYTALHYAAWHNHASVVRVLLEKGAADPDISNRWNKKPVHLTDSSAIQSALWNHVVVVDESDAVYDDYDSSDKMSADVDTSFDEEESDEESVWLSDHESVAEDTWRSSYLSDSEDLSHSTDEIMDAETLYHVHHLTDYEMDEADPKEMNWMQRTLSHFQQPTDNRSFLQNIKNTIPAKPAELNLKTIADHVLEFSRPSNMIANMSVLFGADDATQQNKSSQDEPAAEQALAWYMALAQQIYTAAKKRRDKRLFSFWVPMLCLMVIWLIFQLVSSHPSIADTIISISGFRRQYLTMYN
ncbi:SPT3 Dosage dependent suppressor of Ty-induced promoter mutations-like protein, partial [Rhizopus stolonifer]